MSKRLVLHIVKSRYKKVVGTGLGILITWNFIYLDVGYRIDWNNSALSQDVVRVDLCICRDQHSAESGFE